MIMIQATEKNFDELLSMEKPLMVDFGAEWCGPCKALAPMVADFALPNAKLPASTAKNTLLTIAAV